MPGRRPLISKQLFSLLLGFICLFLGSSPRSVEALDDPSIVYKTIETPHFYVHFDQKMGDLAWRVATISEEAYELLTPVLGWEPAGKTHVVVTDKSDTANGSANVYGRNRMTIFAMPPEPEGVLGYYDDWLRILVYHEFTHILHLDTRGGLAPIINWFIGKQLSPNQTLPRWYTEGLATLYESLQTGTGRVFSSRYRMWLRVASLEDEFLSLGEITGLPIGWPQGNAAYLYGGFFLDYITRTYGQDFIRRFNHEYGSRLIPWSINHSARTVGEKDFDELWEEFTAHIAAKSQAERISVRARGETRLERLTTGGGRSQHLSAHPTTGEVSYFRADLDSAPAFALVGEDQHRDVFDRTLFRAKGANGVHDWSPDGETIYFARRDYLKNVYAFNDLYSRDVLSGRERRITHGERAREPALSPDGTRVAYVRNLHGTMELVVRELQRSTRSEPQVLVSAEQWPSSDERHWLQVATPAWHPTRNLLVFSMWRLDQRRRNLWAFDFEQPEGARLTQLTDDLASDVEPRFGPDGALYFSSDRTEIFNIYQMDIDSGEVQQLSNVLGGVFSPVPSADGRWIYASSYSDRGYEIARFRRRDNPPRPAPASAIQAEWRDYPEVDASDYIEGDYQPVRWLAPLTLYPDIAVLLTGLGVGATLQGHDPVGNHQWEFSGGWASGEQKLENTSAFNLRYQYGGWPIDTMLDLGFRNYPNTSSLFAESQYLPFSENSAFARAHISYPILKADDSLRLSGSFRLHHTTFFSGPEITPDPEDLEPRAPSDSWFGDLNFNLNYSRVNMYPQGISPTDGVSARLGLGLQQDFVDRELNTVNFTYGFSGYLSVPFLKHHVLAGQLSGGIARSTFPGSHGYAIGGYSPQDVLSDIVWQRPSSAFVLRGYPARISSGSQYQVWTAEYRLPLWRLDHGFSTVPVFLRQLKGQLFFDAGRAFDGFLVDQSLLKSVGAELQLDALLGYYIGGALRLGYAHGLSEGGIDTVFLRYGGGF